MRTGFPASAFFKTCVVPRCSLQLTVNAWQRSGRSSPWQGKARPSSPLHHHDVAAGTFYSIHSFRCEDDVKDRTKVTSAKRKSHRSSFYFTFSIFVVFYFYTLSTQQNKRIPYKVSVVERIPTDKRKRGNYQQYLELEGIYVNCQSSAVPSLLWLEPQRKQKTWIIPKWMHRRKKWQRCLKSVVTAVACRCYQLTPWWWSILCKISRYHILTTSCVEEVSSVRRFRSLSLFAEYDEPCEYMSIDGVVAGGDSLSFGISWLQFWFLFSSGSF